MVSDDAGGLALSPAVGAGDGLYQRVVFHRAVEIDKPSCPMFCIIFMRSASHATGTAGSIVGARAWLIV